MNPPDDSGHEGTPRHGLHDDAEPVEEDSEGTYVDDQLVDDDATVHRHPDEGGTYVDSELEEGAGPEHHDPGHGHYVDVNHGEDDGEDDTE